jgi:gamma-glutamyl-gamma-aminobutyrate hydrolase PuuD
MTRLVAVSQRVDVVAAYGERRDALDQRWPRLLRSLELVAAPVPNDPDGIRSWLEAVAPSGVILSGGNSVGDGPDHAPERDALEGALLDWARGRRMPVLGVCRGMQMLNAHLGGRLDRVPGHVAVRHAVAIDGAVRDVNSFHNFGITADGLAPGLEATAAAPDGTIESCRHRELPWQAVMWHPEREPALHDDDRRMLARLFAEAR